MNSEALLSAASALWIEDLRDEVARQVASSAKLHGLSQNVQLMRDLLEPVLELGKKVTFDIEVKSSSSCLGTAHHFVEVYESITNWEDPVYNLILISALVILILNDAFGKSYKSRISSTPIATKLPLRNLLNTKFS